jgi:hypothetical protein
MCNTQSWNIFLNFLVPRCYREVATGAPAGGAFAREAKGLPAWDPAAHDPAFASRLPPSLRTFNAAIGGKLRRLAVGIFTGRAAAKYPTHHSLLAETDWLADTSAAITRHVVIPPPLPVGLPKDVADALSADALLCGGGGGGGLRLRSLSQRMGPAPPSRALASVARKGMQSTSKRGARYLFTGGKAPREDEDALARELERRHKAHAARRRALQSNR